MELINVIAAERGTYIRKINGNHREIVIAWLHIVDVHDDHYVLSATAQDMFTLNHDSIEVVTKTIRDRMTDYRIETAANIR